MEMEAKLRKTVATLLKAGPYPEGDRRRKSKTTVFQTFPTLVQACWLWTSKCRLGFSLQNFTQVPGKKSVANIDTFS